MGKTIADMLREREAGDGWTCWGSVLAEIMGDGECSCPEDTGDRITCHVCYERQLRKLADAIEAENLKFRTMGFLDGLRGHDTQEDIEDDATMPPWAYCEKHGIDVEPGSDESDTVEAMCKHLLRRQRKLLGGD